MKSAKSNFGVGGFKSEFLGTFIFPLCGIGCVAGLKLAGASLGR
jgi:glycerol uptake facilitator protein